MSASATDLLVGHLVDRGLLQGDELPSEVEQLAECDGIAGLLYKLGADSRYASELRAGALAHAALEERHRAVLAEVCGAFARAGIPPLILKGSATAYSLYEEPWTRYRSDTDLFVCEDARHRATELLCALGYMPIATGYDAIACQATFVRRGASADPALDLHWKLSNSEVLSQVFSHKEVLEDARPIPRLNPYAMQASPAISLLLTCMHLADHRTIPYYVEGEAHTSDRLIWLLDVQLLARSFLAADWEAFLENATIRKLGRVAADALRRSEQAFRSLDTVIPGHVSREISRDPGGPVWDYLSATRGRQMWLDFRAFRSTAARIRWARAVMFPPSAYMSGTGEALSAPALAGAYARRIARGLRRLHASTR